VRQIAQAGSTKGTRSRDRGTSLPLSRLFSFGAGGVSVAGNAGVVILMKIVLVVLVTGLVLAVAR
jgi:hypothetical protein